MWLALFAEVLRETVPRADAVLVSELEETHAAFADAVRAREMRRIATSNYEFMQVFTAHSANAVLRRSIRGVVHLVQLGSLHLPKAIDIGLLLEAHRGRRNCTATAVNRLWLNDITEHRTGEGKLYL